MPTTNKKSRYPDGDVSPNIPLWIQSLAEDLDNSTHVSANKFGALGDGTGDSLATKYTSLSLAQVDYPFATSLTQTLDYCGIQAAINYLHGSNPVGAVSLLNAYPTNGGGVVLLVGRCYVVGTTIIQPGGICLVGSGTGGSVFSDTDVSMPHSGTFIKLAAGANCDVIRSINYALLSGTSPAPTYTSPVRLGLKGLVIDGNKNANSSGNCVSYYTDGYTMSDVVIQNAAGDGMISDGDHQAGYDHEALLWGFRIQDNVGNGLNFQGPHDSIIGLGFIARNGGSGFIEGLNIGTSLVSNVHCWGNAVYNWDMQCDHVSHSNCISDGVGVAGIRVGASSVQWRGGTIYGTGAAGEALVQVGNGAGAQTIRGTFFETDWFGVGLGSVPLLYADDGNLSIRSNTFKGGLVASTNTKYIAYASARLASVQAANSATLTFTAGSLARFPSAGSFYTAVGGTLMTISYTGKTSTTLTGCTGGGAGSFAANQQVFYTSNIAVVGAGPGGETVLLDPIDAAGAGFFQEGNLGGGNVSTWYDARNNVNFAGSVLHQQIRTSSISLAVSGAVTINAAAGNVCRVALAANATSSSITNPTTGQFLTVELIQDATGSRTFAWPSNCKFAGGAAPTTSTGSGYCDLVTFRYDGTNWQEVSRSIGVR